MKYNQLILNAIKAAFKNIQNNTKDPDTSLLIKGKVRDRIIRYREQTNILDIVRPKYRQDQLGIINKNEINIYLLKYRLNPKNVTDDEKRLYTLKCCYYDYVPEENLLLIDRILIQYFNYFESTTQMTKIDDEELKRYRVKKNVIVEEEFIINYFSQINVCYTKMLKKGIILPFDFFIHRVIADIYNDLSPTIELLTRANYYTRQMLVCYSVIYNEAIPEDYFIVDENTSTNIHYVRELLNNRKIEPIHPETAKPILTVVK